VRCFNFRDDAVTPIAMNTNLPPQETHWPEVAIFTLGHSTLPIERFVAVLQAYGIERLVDIRTIPRSRYIRIQQRRFGQ
jgi:hypothetical protein